MNSPLVASQAHLKRHFEKVADLLGVAVTAQNKLQLDVNWDVLPVVAALGRVGCESIERNRGRLRANVAPFCELSQGLWTWLGYREEWDSEPAAGPTKRFSFRSSGLTIHFGWRNDTFKPQMFRAEWSGWARWANGDGYQFQAGEAAHPHWQYDALESLPDDDTVDRAKMLRGLLSDVQAEGPKEFAPPPPQSDVRDIVTSQKISRIHFASAAAWWKAAPSNAHSHAPSDPSDIQSWIKSVTGYLKYEFGRL